MWQRFLNQKYLLLILVLATVSGCLGPATIRHVAEDNSQNIANYNINVAAVANALRREAALHGEVQIQLARNKLAGELIQLPQKWLGVPKPTSLDLADPNKEPYKSLKKSVEEASQFLTKISDTLGDKEAITVAVASNYPLAADIALDSPGFSVVRVLDDAFALKELNTQIIAETNPEIRTGLIHKRNSLLGPYVSVRIEANLVQTYIEALEEYLSIVIEQGQVAASHANAIAAYAQAKPQISTLASTLQDQELRGAVLEYVKEKKSERYSKRVESYLIKADNLVEAIRSLSGSK